MEYVKFVKTLMKIIKIVYIVYLVKMFLIVKVVIKPKNVIYSMDVVLNVV